MNSNDIVSDNNSDAGRPFINNLCSDLCVKGKGRPKLPPYRIVGMVPTICYRGRWGGGGREITCRCCRSEGWKLRQLNLSYGRGITRSLDSVPSESAKWLLRRIFESEWRIKREKHNIYKFHTYMYYPISETSTQLFWVMNLTKIDKI